MSRLESDYYAFMGYGSDHARDVLSHYLQFFGEGPVLELACGRGEFLDLLSAAGVATRGVDLDEGMVQLARGRGHEVALGDAVAHLEEVAADSLGGVFCAHFLEHLEPGDVDRVYRAAGRALRPGGRFVAAVPSAGSLSVLGYDFWRDPTHVRFYDPMLLAFFAGQAGLTVLESGGNPCNDPGPPPLLTPLDFEPAPTLTASVAGLWAAVAEALPPPPPPPPEPARRWLHRDNGTDGTDADGTDVATLADPAADPRIAPWSHLVHLLSVMDQRAQVMQHQYAELHRAYKALLAQLYPPNEVYVVAAVPGGGPADPGPGA